MLSIDKISNKIFCIYKLTKKLIAVIRGKGLWLSFSCATYSSYRGLYESQFSQMKSEASHVYMPQLPDYVFI